MSFIIHSSTHTLVILFPFSFSLTTFHFSLLGELDDALVIVMADHGHRFAKLRETHQGQLEEVGVFSDLSLTRDSFFIYNIIQHYNINIYFQRLPFFAISLPDKFRRTEHGRKMYTNLLNNKDR